MMEACVTQQLIVTSGLQLNGSLDVIDFNVFVSGDELTLVASLIVINGIVR